MKPIIIPKSYNYISAFLTFACNFKCHYCINKYNNLFGYTQMTTESWVMGLNRIKTTNDRPVTLTGGEPTLYKGFYDLVNGINNDISLDLLTNGSFDVEEFMEQIPPYRMRRESKYASIRISYHPGYTNLDDLECVAKTLHDIGYSVGIWAVETTDVQWIKTYFESLGIDFRVKEYLDSDHGTYKYPEALDGKPKSCLCKPSELLIAPDGRLFRCHSDLYRGINSYGHLLDEDLKLPEDFSSCDQMGLCNPCDIKMKFDRFQEVGHCSVTIKD